MKTLKIYFDTEFTGLKQNTTLISIGLVTEYNENFYAEFIDYDKDSVDEWIEKNVIDKLCLNTLNVNQSKNIDNYIMIRGTKDGIHHVLMSWLYKLKSIHEIDRIQFISDVCHYDFVLLIDLISEHALDLPDFISPYCHDINQDIAKYYNISDYEAFDKNREDIIGVTDTGAIERQKHVAIWDAHTIFNIHRLFQKNS